MQTSVPEIRASRYSHFVESDCRLFDDMSMLTVAELIADPELGLELVGGPRAAPTAKSRPPPSPSWPIPGPWLQGGELLLTIGLLLPQTDRRLPVLPRRTRRRRCAGHRAGARRRAPPSSARRRRLITAADEIGMPLLTVPDPVPFIAVTKAVFAYRARAERQELEWALQTQRALTAAAVTPGGLLGILAAHRDATGRTGVVDRPARPGAGRIGSRRRAVGRAAVRAAGLDRAIRASTPRPPTSATAAGASCTHSAPTDYGPGC